MTFSKEALSVFQSVLHVENKNAISIELAQVGEGLKLKLNTTTLPPSMPHIIVDGILIVASQSTQKALAQMQFVVEDGNITLKSLSPCACVSQISKLQFNK